jgi:hypothetical protein
MGQRLLSPNTRLITAWCIKISTMIRLGQMYIFLYIQWIVQVNFIENKKKCNYRMIMAGDRCQIGRDKKHFDKWSSKGVSRCGVSSLRASSWNWLKHILHVDKDDRISPMQDIIYLFVLIACSFEFTLYLFYYSSKMAMKWCVK